MLFSASRIYPKLSAFRKLPIESWTIWILKTLNSLHCGAQSKLYLEPHLDVTLSRKPSWTPNSGLVRDYELPQQPVLSLRCLYHDVLFISTASLEGGGHQVLCTFLHYITTIQHTEWWGSEHRPRKLLKLLRGGQFILKKKKSYSLHHGTDCS